MNITTAITPASFHRGQEQFTAGNFRHIAAALNGAQCVIVDQSGSAFFGVTLGALRPYRPGHLAAVEVTSDTGYGTFTDVEAIAMVIPVTGDAGRAAVAAQHAERDAAIAIIKDENDVDAVDGGRGTWHVTSLHDRLDVKYVPYVVPGARRARSVYGKVDLRDITANLGA